MRWSVQCCLQNSRGQCLVQEADDSEAACVRPYYGLLWPVEKSLYCGLGPVIPIEMNMFVNCKQSVAPPKKKPFLLLLCLIYS